MPRAFILVALGLLALFTAACESAHARDGSVATAKGDDRIVRVHASRCGTCHVRVERGERTRAQLENAFVRHRKRVRLTEDEWAKMIEYLAAAPERARGDDAAQVLAR